MKTLILSYSFTGNNGKLARGIARGIEADYSVLTEKKKRTILTILLDVLFSRTPVINKIEHQIDTYDRLVFVGPVWFGKLATPFREVLNHLNGKAKNYAFVSLSAGADGKNPNLERELIKRTGIKPGAVINPLISELLPAEPKPSRKALDAYRLSDDEAGEIVKKVIDELKK